MEMAGTDHYLLVAKIGGILGILASGSAPYIFVWTRPATRNYRDFSPILRLFGSYNLDIVRFLRRTVEAVLKPSLVIY
jgi:hypothetical protein